MEPRLTADLDIKPGDLVWDVGGFEGRWAADILVIEPFVRLKVFEPVPTYARTLKKRGLDVEQYGLSDFDHEPEITIAGDRSSVFEMGHAGIGKQKIQLRDASAILADQRLAVMKLNIEGAEYQVLDRLIACNKMRQIGTLIIQFHTFIPDFGEKYLAIKRGLTLTHSLTWRDPFVWERWDRK
jgi:FkbM family methyltransferase